MNCGRKKGGRLAAPFALRDPSISRTPRRAAARVALPARAVAHQGEVAAFAAGLALVALGLGLGAFLGRHSSRASASVSNIGAGVRLGEGGVLLLELLGRRELALGLGLQCRCA